MKLPDRIYVHVEDAGTDDAFLIADSNLTNLDDGTIVGTYQLVETRTLEVRRELV